MISKQNQKRPNSASHMDLFRQAIEQPINLLNRDGIVKYYGALISWESADDYFNRLLSTIEWKSDESMIMGKRIVTKRKVAWHANQPFTYTYSGTTKRALPWTQELVELKTRVEKQTGEPFNACLLNLYHDGSEGMAWHSDGEKDLKKNFPKKNWNKLHLQIIWYGREYCKARACYGISCKICKSCYPNRKKPFKTMKA